MPGVMWDTLTRVERLVLEEACRQGLNPKRLRYRKQVVEDLAEIGLLQLARNRKGRPLWRPTGEGIVVYAQRGLVPTFLHKQSQYGYTHRFGSAMVGEPEVIV